MEEYVREMYQDLKEVKAQTTMTNGRVSLLEQWQREMVQKQREADAFKAGASTRLFNKRQMAAGISAIGVVTGAVGSIVAIVIEGKP